MPRDFSWPRRRKPSGSTAPFADHLRVERSYERAVDALLGDLLQHVIVDRAEQVSQALAHLDEPPSRADAASSFSTTRSSRRFARRRHRCVDARALARSRDTRLGRMPTAIVRALPKRSLRKPSRRRRRLPQASGLPVATLEGESLPRCRAGRGRRPGRRHTAFSKPVPKRRRCENRFARQKARPIRPPTDVTASDLHIVIGENDVVEKQQALHDLEKAIVSPRSATGARATDEMTRVSRRIELVRTERRRSEEDERAAEGRRESRGPRDRSA